MADEDAVAMQQLSPLIKFYIPWTTSAIRPAALSKILNDIKINNRECVLELGAGISTLLIATLFAEMGRGSLITVEHDSGWLRNVEQQLKAAGLGHCVSFIHAPLVACAIARESNTWFDPKAFDQISRPINTLVVDGPPAYAKGAELARYPALPICEKMLSENCSVFLDDADRPGERAVVKLWEQNSSLRFSRIPGNMFMSVRGHAWNIV